MDELRNFGSGPRELTGDVDLINHFKLLNHHDFFCKRSLPVSVSETHYLNNVVGDTEIRKGGEMQLNQLLQNSSLQRGTHARMQPFALNSLREAFQLKEAAPVDLPLVEKGISTFPKKKGSSKDKDSERKHMKHKIKDIDKEHKKHKHRHKDRTKDKHRYMDKKKIGRDSKKNHDSLSLGVGREGSFLFRNSFCSSFVSFWLSSFLPLVGMLPAVVDFRGGFRGVLFAGLVDVGVVFSCCRRLFVRVGVSLG